MYPANIVWRTKLNGTWGRWRNSEGGGPISFTQKGTTLVIQEPPGATETFSAGDLK
jgi:hypothetical protein